MYMDNGVPDSLPSPTSFPFLSTSSSTPQTDSPTTSFTNNIPQNSLPLPGPTHLPPPPPHVDPRQTLGSLQVIFNSSRNPHIDSLTTPTYSLVPPIYCDGAYRATSTDTCGGDPLHHHLGDLSSLRMQEFTLGDGPVMFPVIASQESASGSSGSGAGRASNASFYVQAPQGANHTPTSPYNSGADSTMSQGTGNQQTEFSRSHLMEVIVGNVNDVAQRTMVGSPGLVQDPGTVYEAALTQTMISGDSLAGGQGPIPTIPLGRPEAPCRVYQFLPSTCPRNQSSLPPSSSASIHGTIRSPVITSSPLSTTSSPSDQAVASENVQKASIRRRTTTAKYPCLRCIQTFTTKNGLKSMSQAFCL
ncbi:hypothetical protein VNI00_006017 [Paramarasmius palmivorus]|uniref:Early growth response 1 n=1 Tax=Paramarasmius palmivorus TaxID=297713 RepID=A0AAW0DD68_9AGAR